MDETHQTPPSPVPQPTEAAASEEPTLLDLAIDDSWLDQPNTPPAEPAELPAESIDEPETTGWRRWVPHRRQTSTIDQSSIDELATDDTIAADLTPDPLWKTWLKTGCAFLVSAIASYVILTLPSQVVKAAYFVNHLGKTETPSKIVQASATTSGNFEDVVQPALSFRAPNDSPPPTSNSSTASSFADLADNELFIPKLSVRAPIIWDSSFEEKTMLDNLQKGVVHYGGTDFPSAQRGNVFITGHSSYYWWDKGQYKTVFAVLDKLSVGDQVALTYQRQVYVYEMTDSIVVKPTQVDVLNSSDQPILSLMTCTPVGTSLNRLIVHAKLIGVYAQGADQIPVSPAESTVAPEAAQDSQSAPSPAPTQPIPAAESASGPNDSLELLPGRP